MQPQPSRYEDFNWASGEQALPPERRRSQRANKSVADRVRSYESMNPSLRKRSKKHDPVWDDDAEESTVPYVRPLHPNIFVRRTSQSQITPFPSLQHPEEPEDDSLHAPQPQRRIISRLPGNSDDTEVRYGYSDQDPGTTISPFDPNRSRPGLHTSPAGLLGSSAFCPRHGRKYTTRQSSSSPRGVVEIACPDCLAEIWIRIDDMKDEFLMMTDPAVASKAREPKNDRTAADIAPYQPEVIFEDEVLLVTFGRLDDRKVVVLERKGRAERAILNLRRGEPYTRDKSVSSNEDPSGRPQDSAESDKDHLPPSQRGQSSKVGGRAGQDKPKKAPGLVNQLAALIDNAANDMDLNLSTRSPNSRGSEYDESLSKLGVTPTKSSSKQQRQQQAQTLEQPTTFLPPQASKLRVGQPSNNLTSTPSKSPVPPPAFPAHNPPTHHHALYAPASHIAHTELDEDAAHIEETFFPGAYPPSPSAPSRTPPRIPKVQKSYFDLRSPRAAIPSQAPIRGLTPLPLPQALTPASTRTSTPALALNPVSNPTPLPDPLLASNPTTLIVDAPLASSLSQAQRDTKQEPIPASAGEVPNSIKAKNDNNQGEGPKQKPDLSGAEGRRTEGKGVAEIQEVASSEPRTPPRPSSQPLPQAQPQPHPKPQLPPQPSPLDVPLQQSSQKQPPQQQQQQQQQRHKRSTVEMRREALEGKPGGGPGGRDRMRERDRERERDCCRETYG